MNFNKTLVIISLFLLLLYIINDLDDHYEQEGCHRGVGWVRNPKNGRWVRQLPALPNDQSIGVRYRNPVF